MTCDQARELLLEAAPGELEGTGASALSRHLGGCPRCAAAAARVLEATRALDAHLGAPPDEGAVEAVLARLVDAGTHRRAPLARPTRPHPRWRRAAWGTAAMAAAAAGLLLVTRGPAPVHEGMPRVATVPPLPLVETSSAATVAVLETGNPDITVLWFF